MAYLCSMRSSHIGCMSYEKLLCVTNGIRICNRARRIVWTKKIVEGMNRCKKPMRNIIFTTCEGMIS